MATSTQPMIPQIELTDMLENYPSNKLPGFQTILSAKKEFRELASTTIESLPPGRGQLFKHQRMYLRYLRAYDDLLIMDETGTGKSCSVLAFTEYALKEVNKRKQTNKNIDQSNAHFKRVIVLVKGANQKEEFKKQLVCKCSDGRFETKAVREAATPELQRRAVTSAIKAAGYKITTYGKFSNYLNKTYPMDIVNAEDSVARLAADYADTIFWIDEAHNLVGTDLRSDQKKSEVYNTLWLLLHLPPRCKHILTSATPMINDESEFAQVLNLILPENGILPADLDFTKSTPTDIRVLFPNLPAGIDPQTATDEEMAPYFQGQIPLNMDFNTVTIEELEPYFRGRIGFIRASKTGAVSEYRGELISILVDSHRSQIRVWPSVMSDFQQQAYLQAQSRNRDGRNTLYTPERQAANFVFPDGQWGGGTSEEEKERRRLQRAQASELTLDPQALTLAQGTQQAASFARYISVNGDDFYAKPEFVPYISSLKEVQQLSAKFAEILRLADEAKGIVFIYSEYVEGSGLIPLALAAQYALKYDRYTSSESVFTSNTVETLPPYCASTSMTNRNIKIPKANRYAVVTSDTRKRFASIMETLNSYENRHGEYIKIIFSSRVFREGVNLQNVIQIHLVGAEWNVANMYQSVSRGLRATSHDDLLEEKRQELIAAGENPALARVDVEIYRHAAIAPRYNNADDLIENIDIRMYVTAEDKDRRIKRIMRMMKQCAIGCQIHYQRNVREDDEDYTAECDYDICRYSCFDPRPEYIDYSTYDVLYAQEVIDRIRYQLMNVYSQIFKATFSQLRYDYLKGNYLPRYILFALEQLISLRTPIRNRYGYINYLQEGSGYFFLNSNYPTKELAEYAISYYSEHLINIASQDLTGLERENAVTTDVTVFQLLSNLVPGSPEFNTLFDTLNADSRIRLYEKAIVDEVAQHPSALTNYMRRKYHLHEFQVHELVTELEKYATEISKPQIGGGRRRLKQDKDLVKITEANAAEFAQIIDNSTEVVYIHRLIDNLGSSEGAYADNANFRKGGRNMRIYKPSEGSGWRDMKPSELYVYDIFVQNNIRQRLQAFDQLPIAGSYVGGEFKIIDRLKQSERAAADSRLVSTGRNCKTKSLADLANIAYYLGIRDVDRIKLDQQKNNITMEVYLPVSTEVLSPQSRNLFANTVAGHKPALVDNNMVSQLVNWEDERLRTYEKWSTRKMTRDDFCLVIADMLKRRNMFLEYYLR